MGGGLKPLEEAYKAGMRANRQLMESQVDEPLNLKIEDREGSAIFRGSMQELWVFFKVATSFYGGFVRIGGLFDTANTWYQPTPESKKEFLERIRKSANPPNKLVFVSDKAMWEWLNSGGTVTSFSDYEEGFIDYREVQAQLDNDLQELKDILNGLTDTDLDRLVGGDSSRAWKKWEGVRPQEIFYEVRSLTSKALNP